MPFRSGTIAYARFDVHGGPETATEELLEAAAANVIRPPAVGAPPEVQAGLTAGRHMLDESFDAEECLFEDTVLLGMRLDVCRVPAEVRRAYRELAERAQQASGNLGRAGRADARDEADERCREELARGQHRRTKHVPILWRVRDRVLLAPAFGDAMATALIDLFQSSFDCTLERSAAGGLARTLLARRGGIDELRPSALSTAPVDSESGGETPLVPWAPAHGAEPDFLGNEMLAWLWHRARRGTTEIETSEGTISVAMTGSFDLECAWDTASRMALHASAPARAPETRAGLRNGKWPRKAGLLVATPETSFQCTLQGDRFHVSGLRVTPSEAVADELNDERSRTMWRVNTITDVDRALVAMYGTFLEERTSDEWTTTRTMLRRTIEERTGVRPAAPVEVAAPPAPAPEPASPTAEAEETAAEVAPMN